MTKEEKRQLLAKLWTPEHARAADEFGAWMQRTGIGGHRASSVLGISRSALSQILSHKYTGRVGAICDKIKRHLRRMRLRMIAPSRPPYATTSVTEQVVQACGIAHTERVIALVLGPSGCGKSVGLQRYCEREPEALYIVAGVNATSWAIVRLLATILDCNHTQSTHQLRTAVSEALRDSGRLLIVDECDYMPEDTLQALRMIHDSAGIGMVWAGTSAYLQKLRNQTSSTSRQVLRRIQYAVRLGRCSEDDLAAILGYYELAPDVLDAVVAGAHGEAGRAVAIVVAARRIVGPRGSIDLSTVQQALTTLMPIEE